MKNKATIKLVKQRFVVDERRSRFPAGVNETKSRFRSSRPEVFCKKAVLRNFAKFTGKHLCQSLFFNKVAASKNTFSYRTPLVGASADLR